MIAATMIIDDDSATMNSEGVWSSDSPTMQPAVQFLNDMRQRWILETSPSMGDPRAWLVRRAREAFTEAKVTFDIEPDEDDNVVH